MYLFLNMAGSKTKHPNDFHWDVLFLLIGHIFKALPLEHGRNG